MCRNNPYSCFVNLSHFKYTPPRKRTWNIWNLKIPLWKRRKNRPKPSIPGFKMFVFEGLFPPIFADKHSRNSWKSPVGKRLKSPWNQPLSHLSISSSRSHSHIYHSGKWDVTFLWQKKKQLNVSFWVYHLQTCQTKTVNFLCHNKFKRIRRFFHLHLRHHATFIMGCGELCCPGACVFPVTGCWSGRFVLLELMFLDV